jgi:hypothetical protein
MTASLYLVGAMCILDESGETVFSKYFPMTGLHCGANTKNGFMSVNERQHFEHALFEKTKSDSHAQIQLLEDFVVLFKPMKDVIFYVTCPLDANELLANCVLDTWMAVCQESMAKGSLVDKSILLDNYDILSLIADEIIDNG